ncbi:MAG: hypothetical protein A3G42_03570 [Gammaproteobacteria bacterium RIFCSPLOWO2_12_FULL_47_76]|nr:MAG: hypothetical protein A3G42_03570 [Gammaproteobacteria bacterium RIFCSPLOWO2_12_FULL_47_76]
MMGNNEVAGIGMAWVIHHVAINTVTAATRIATVSTPSGVGNSNTSKNKKGPRNRPIVERVIKF